MTQSSYYGQLTRMPAASFDADEPVSATRAFNTRSNLLHLQDSFCQTRINWAAAQSGTTYSGSGYVGGVVAVDIGGFLYEQPFQWTWLGANRPANMDLLIRSAADAGVDAEMDVRVRIVPDSYALGDLSSPAIVDETHTVTSASGLWEDQFRFYEDNDATVMGLLQSSILRGRFLVADSGEWTYPEVSLLRIQVQGTPIDGGSPEFYLLTGVLVREFP